MAEVDNKQEESGKVEKRFTQNMAKLAAVFSNNQRKVLGRKTKVPNADISNIVDELLKERRVETVIKFKARCGELLDKKIQFDRDIAEEEVKFKKIKEQKMEEFSKAIEETFGLIESIDKLAGDYAKVLDTQAAPELPIVAAGNP